MLTMAASGIRSTLSSWFSCPSRKRPAIEMETPDENSDPNIPLQPRKKKIRRTNPRSSRSIDGVRRRLFVEPGVNVKQHRADHLTTTNDIAHLSDGMGQLMILPIELMHMILTMLDGRTLTLIATVSKDFNDCIISYLLTGPGLRHILCYKSETCDPSHYSEAGNVLRRITATKNLRHRLKIASQVSNKVRKSEMKPICEKVLMSAGSALAYKCFGRLFFQYIINWSEYDKLRAYCFIEKLTKLNQKVSNILRLSPGALPWHEYDLRQLVCTTLLEPFHSDKDYSFWLSQLLKGYPLTHQARLLYIFTGPTDSSGFVYWSVSCDCSSPTHIKEPTIPNREKDMTNLARGLRVLLTERKEWTMDATISIFDEMTTTPTGWCLGQVATLLMLSGTEVTQAILGHRAVNGHITDLSVLAYYLAHACVKEDNEKPNSHKLSWYLDVIRYVVSMLAGKGEKQWFSYSLIHHWQSYLTSLFEEDEISDDLSDFEQIRQEFLVSLSCFSKLSVLLLTKLTLSN